MSLFGSELTSFIPVVLLIPTLYSPPALTPKPNARRKVPKKAEQAPQPSTSQHIVVDDPPYSTGQSTGVAVNIPNMEVLVSQEAVLYLYDFNTELFENQGIVTAQISRQTGTNFAYWLTASTSSGGLLYHQISSDMNQRWSHKMFSLTWNHLEDDDTQRSWLFKFHNQEDFANILAMFTHCLWETLHQMSWGKAKVCHMSWPIGCLLI